MTSLPRVRGLRNITRKSAQRKRVKRAGCFRVSGSKNIQEKKTMAQTILEALSTEQPNGIMARNESLDIAYTLVKLHMDEIEEARKHGYSWKQIEMVCKKLWKTNAKNSKIIWPKNNSLIRKCCEAIKEGRKPQYLLTPKKSMKTPTKKYNIEVTEA